MKKISTVLLLILSLTAIAGFPPPSTKGAGDSGFVGTFKTDYGTIPVTRPNGVLTIGTIPTTAGGTGSTNLGTGVVKATAGVLATGAVSLITDVSNILPIANGGTGSSTQNFVDLSNNQTISGIKTFNSTIAGSVTGNAGTVTNGVYTTNKLSALSATTSTELAGVISDETGTGNLVFSDNPTFTNLNIGSAAGNITGNAATVTTNANLTGEVTSTGNAATLTNSAVIGKVLTGYTSGTGTVSATDSLLQAIQKLNGNDAAFTLKSTLSAKGDIYAATAASTPARLAVGGDGAVLTASSVAGTGLVWSNPTIATKAVNDSGTTNTPLVQVPYKQLTLNSSTSALFETGNENMLANPGFEADSLTSWTCTTGTCTKTTTSGEFSSGLAAMKIVPAANVIDVSQSINTTAGIQKQGAVGILYRVPSTCSSTFAIISLVDGSAQSTVTGSNQLIFDDAYHWKEIPTTFGATSAGIKISAAATCTGNIFVDAAYVKQGIGTQNLMLDYDYTAQVSATGVISGLSKAGWLSGNCVVTNTSQYDCPVASGLVTTQMNCQLTAQGAIMDDRSAYYDYTNSSSSNVRYRTTNSSNAAATAYAMSLKCSKTGNDYISSSSQVYTASSANTDWTACTFSTLAMQGLGTIANTSLMCRRNNGMLEMKGRFTTGTVAAAEAQFLLPSNYGSITTATITGTESAGHVMRNSATTGILSNVLATSGANYFRFSGPLISAATNSNTAVNGSAFFGSTEVQEFSSISIPISGWSNSASIVGSFQDYVSTSGSTKPIRFRSTISSAGSLSGNRGGYISSASCTSGNWTITLTGSPTVDQCTAGINEASNYFSPRAMTKSSSSITFTTINSTATAACASSIDLVCDGVAP